jgi:hypothetical protein
MYNGGEPGEVKGDQNKIWGGSSSVPGAVIVGSLARVGIEMLASQGSRNISWIDFVMDRPDQSDSRALRTENRTGTYNYWFFRP